jgi:hypothetical protein
MLADRCVKSYPLVGIIVDTPYCIETIVSARICMAMHDLLIGNDYLEAKSVSNKSVEERRDLTTYLGVCF